jgi:hypothetical protein
MGFFNFSKQKKNNFSDAVQQMRNKMFPKGEKDIEAGTIELMEILNNSVSKNEANKIFTKSYTIAYLTEQFDKERLIYHLKGYCIQYFNDVQISRLYDYLLAIKMAMIINQKTPSEIRRIGEGYGW